MASNNPKAFGIGQKASVFKANSLDRALSQLAQRCLGPRPQRGNINEEDSYLLNKTVSISDGKSGVWDWYHYTSSDFTQRYEYLKCYSLREHHPPLCGRPKDYSQHLNVWFLILECRVKCRNQNDNRLPGIPMRLKPKDHLYPFSFPETPLRLCSGLCQW